MSNSERAGRRVIPTFGVSQVTEAQLRKICGSNSELFSKARLRQEEFSIIKAQSDQFDADAKHSAARISKNIVRIATVMRRLNLILKQEPIIAEILAKDIGIKSSKLTKLTKQLELATTDRSAVSGTFRRGRKGVEGRGVVPIMMALLWADICRPEHLRAVLARTFTEIFRCPRRAAKREAAQAYRVAQKKSLGATTMALRQANGGVLFDQKGLIDSKEQNDEISVQQYIDLSNSRRAKMAPAKGRPRSARTA